MRAETELRPYQDRIATHLYQHDNALCVVRPGGGKTIAALTAIKELKRDGVIRQALVIAPKRVAENVWPAEIAEWAHTQGVRFAVLDGDPINRLAILACCNPSNIDLVIVGIDLVQWLLDTLQNAKPDAPIFDLLVIDEISKLRNPTGVRAKLLAKHADRWRMLWGLSGTLRPSSALDLFMPARIVTRGKLWGRSFYQWRQSRFYPSDYMGYNWQPLPGMEDLINADIAPLTVTLRADEYPQLPALSVQFDRITLPDNARQAYQTMHRKLVAHLEQKDIVAVNSAVASGKLAQIANGFLYSVTGKLIAEELHDEKREWLTDVIEQAAGPTLLIYEYQHDLEMLRDLIPNLPYIGEKPTAAGSSANIENWNAGRLPFLALHPAAGGHGLNLQHGGADMAWIAPCWSPEYWEQTIARIHRSGQTKPVIVRVCVVADTVDEMKLNRVHFKMTAQQAFEKYLAQQEAAR